MSYRFAIVGCGRGTKDLDGGILFTQSSHFTDLLYWFLGDIKAVSGLIIYTRTA
ncbi:MAG: hypothetical protein JNL51_17025 [Chitinophagaceae bacterium]|nr:hypothetical protein [Chitinophagaceae bacterium]